jgi:hypothetical protein
LPKWIHQAVVILKVILTQFDNLIMQLSKLIPAPIFEPLTGEKAAELTDLRLPSNLNNCIRVQQRAYDPDHYTVEESVHFKDEKGIRTKKGCPVTNFIRWRYVDSKTEDVES